MSQLTKSLTTRIHELTASVEAQSSELAAYRRLLQIELAKESGSTESSAGGTGPQKQAASTPSALPVEPASIPFSGNKTTLVGDIVRSLGRAGAAPKDVEKVFNDRKIKRSKNLIYNTLSYLVAQKKLQRRDGRYFGVTTAPASPSASAAPTKRHISPEGIKRIREAVQKRWAAKRAAERAAAK
jgi:hypothetical protein